MAISVKNISPEKLTSLLNWFSKNADEIYQNGTPGAKNVLDNALMRRPAFDSGIHVMDFPVKQTVLSKANDNLLYGANSLPVGNVRHSIIENFNSALDNSKYKYWHLPDTSVGLGEVVDWSDNMGIPTVSYPKFTVGSVQLPQEIPVDNLVRVGGFDSFIRPHKNTALQKWYESQLQNQFKNYYSDLPF